MSFINFYEITIGNINRVACQLLEKAYNKSYKTLAITKDIEAETTLDKDLWTFAQKSFIPHATSSDIKPEEQPIYITSTHTNKNSADTLFLIGTIDHIFEPYERIYVLFEASDVNIVSTAKICYQKLNIPSNALAYYTQDHKGIWQPKIFT